MKTGNMTLFLTFNHRRFLSFKFKGWHLIAISSMILFSLTFLTVTMVIDYNKIKNDSDIIKANIRNIEKEKEILKNELERLLEKKKDISDLLVNEIPGD